MNNKGTTKNSKSSGKGDWSYVAVETLSPSGTTEVGEEPRSIIAHLENSIMRNETNKKILREKNADVFHERGEVNHNSTSPGNILPFLGITGRTKSEQQKETERAMQWEITTHQGRVPPFVFKMEQSPKRNGSEGNSSREEEVLGPMAVTFNKEVG